MLSRALEGFTVADFSQGIAGPHAGLLLAEMGADVVKVEPPGGDWVRGLGVRRGDSSVLFGYLNRGKRGAAFDLKTASGREAARRLALRADVLIESNRPGVMARLGLDDASLRPHNPKLVYLSLSGYGQDGPAAGQPGTDAVLQAFTGLSFAAGDMREPVRVRVALVDVLTGLYASHAVLAALLRRSRTGAGQHLDVSLMHGSAALQGYKYAEFVASAGVLKRELYAGVGIYRTADGYIALSAMRDEQVEALMRCVGCGALLDDARFATPAARFEHQEALSAALSQAIAARETAHWTAILQREQLLCQPVLDYAAFMREPQVAAHALFQQVPAGGSESLTVVRMPGMTADELRAQPAPALGADTRSVLRESGYDDAGIDALLREGCALAAD